MNNREIKFRAWDGEQMISPDWVNRRGEACWLSNGIPETTDKVMQYIGEVDMSLKKIYESDIVDVCIFFVSPANPDDDQHFRGVINFDNGAWYFKIYKMLYFNDHETEWRNINTMSNPFDDDSIDEDGTVSVPLHSFMGNSGNLGEWNNDNIEIVGNLFETPELLK